MNKYCIKIILLGAIIAGSWGFGEALAQPQPQPSVVYPLPGGPESDPYVITPMPDGDYVYENQGLMRVVNNKQGHYYPGYWNRVQYRCFREALGSDIMPGVNDIYTNIGTGGGRKVISYCYPADSQGYQVGHAKQVPDDPSD